MWKRMFYFFVCIIFLAGCAKTVSVNDVKIKSNETKVNDGEEIKEKQETEKTQTIKQTEERKEALPSKSNQEDSTHSIKDKPQCESVAKKYNLPEGFEYVDDVIPEVELEIRYYTEYNFVGERIDGYKAPFAILTTQAVQALKMAEDKLEEDGYHIKIYDAYRPQKAVNHFVRWSQTTDADMKDIFYPSMDKAVLFMDGYISKKSRHSRGSTVDLTIIDENGQEIDMGGYFDLLDTLSNYDTNQITDEQHENREYLRNIMDQAGFDSIRTEWWHFQLREEPYPAQYFDFDIE